MTSARVLHVVLRLDPGGTERLVIEIVRRLQPRLGMAVCCLDAEGAWAGEVRALGAEVVALGRAPGVQPRLALEIAALLRRTGASVIHCHHYSPFVYGRLAAALVPGTTVVFTEHGRSTDAPPSAKRRLATSVLVQGVRHLYSVSHDLRRHLLAEGFPERMGVVWNGIDPGRRPDAAERGAARAALGVGDADLVVGTVARLDPVKDLGTLLAGVAAARRVVPRVRLVIVGGGDERARLEAEARAQGLGDRARFLGARDDVRGLLPGVDVYANSSVTEGVSLTLLEAMAAERPVVATRVGGTPEVVEDGRTGLLVPARQPEALAAALATLAHDPGRRSTMGQAGRQRVLAHFTLDAMVAAYEPIYAGATR